MALVIEAASLPVDAVAVLVACLLGAALVSSIETSLVGISEARVRAAVAERLPGAQALSYWVREPGRVLMTLQLVRISLVLGSGLWIWRELGPVTTSSEQILVTVGLAIAVLMVSYLVPRALAKPHALRWAISTIRVVRVLSFVLAPLVWPLGALVRGVGRLAGGSSSTAAAFWTPDEITRLSADAETATLGKRSKELLRSIIEFSDTVIREIMVPRTEMVAVEVQSSAREIRTLVSEGGHSRVPVYEETVDNIVGVLHIKDLFATLLSLPSDGAEHSLNLRGSVRPTFYVPEVMKISELLREFQRRKTHMAIVVDEYGGTAGVVTLEDVIEEIVGEIQDEYDVEEKQFRVLADNKLLADGRVSIWDLEEALSIDFPDDADYETLAGFIMSRTGYLPRPGAVITWGQFRFTIKEADEKRIATVEIERKKIGDVRPEEKPGTSTGFR
jgi:putative hemolysin